MKTQSSVQPAALSQDGSPQVVVRGSIRRKLLTTLVGLIVGLVITLTSIELFLQKQFLTAELNKRVGLMHANLIERSQTLANVLLPQVENDMAAFNFSRIGEVLSKAIEESTLLEYAVLMNSESVVFSHSEQPEADDFNAFLHGEAQQFALSQTTATSQEYPAVNIIEKILPIQLGIKQWGVLRLGFTTEELQREIARSNEEIMHQTTNMVLTSAIIALIFIAIASSIVLLIANKLSSPLIHLTLFAKQLAQGNFDSVDALASPSSAPANNPLHADGEIGQLGHNFVDMARQIRQSQQQLETYNRTLEEKVQERTQELEQANLKLQELDQLKTNFLSTVSHELRTPLTSVLGFARIIQKKFESDLLPVLQDSGNKKIDRTIKQILSNTNIIVEEGERLTHLINDVLDLAKMEAGRTDWNMRPIQIEDIIERAMASTSSLFEFKDVELRKAFAANTPEIEGDRDKLIQVVINLISNAIKFTDHGAVTLKTELTDDFVIVSVTDSGCGIKPEDQLLVFEKFKQVGDTLTDKPKGTGLGLPICKEIVEHHGGSVWVSSILGEGSTFSFSLPRPHLTTAATATLEGPDYAVSFERRMPRAALESHLQQAALIKSQNASETVKRILIVDDDPNIRQLLTQELSNEGFNVSNAESGLACLDIINAQLPDLIILDVCMPHLNGFAAAARLRNDPCTLALPIVMHTVAEDQKMGELLHINRYLTKPVPDKQLVETIKTVFADPDLDQAQHVVLWDEEHARAQALAKQLQFTGHHIHQAESVAAVLEACQTWPVRLIIAPATSAEHQGLADKIQALSLATQCFYLLLD